MSVTLKKIGTLFGSRSKTVVTFIMKKALKSLKKYVGIIFDVK